MPTAAAETDPTPSPAPASQVRTASAPPGRKLSFREALQRAHEETDIAGLCEAERLYRGDDARERADIEAGRHPLQRGGEHLNAAAQYDADVAELRRTLG